MGSHPRRHTSEHNRRTGPKARGRAWRPPSWVPPGTIASPPATSRPIGRYLVSAHVVADLEPFPGAVAIASVRRHGPEGKLRPVVLVEELRAGDAWVVWCLTTRPAFRDGKPRAAAVGAEQIGLVPGFVWGASSVASACEIEGVVWAAPLELLLACALADRGDPGVQARLAGRLHEAHLDAGWYWPK